MEKRTKIVVIASVSLLALVVVGVVIGNAVATSKIENFLKTSLPSDMVVTYDELDVSILSGRVALSNPIMSMTSETTEQKSVEIKQQSLVVDGLSIWRFLLKDQIDIDAIIMDSPIVSYNYNKLIPKDKSKSSKPKPLQKEIKINKFKVTNGNMIINDATNDSLIMQMKKLDFEMSDIIVDVQTLKSKIPFKFGEYTITFDDFFYRLNEFDDLKLQRAMFSNTTTTIENLQLFTKYSKTELSKLLKVERDHMNLNIAELNITNQDFGFKNDSVFYFSTPKVILKQPNLKVFRDKLVADDPTIKSLYSKMLRSLNFDLNLSELEVENGNIIYTERVKEDNTGGSISFSDLNATMKNVSNTYQTPEKTAIDIKATFMKTTPISVHWDFDVNNANDHFVFQGEIGRMPAADMNVFSVPNLGVKMEGELSKTYFTIDGNANTSAINLRMNYDDFKVVVLDKDGRQKKKLLSAVANLFISKDSEDSHNDFREGSKAGVERDKTKSIFNFLWVNISGGLVNAMLGDGKK